MNGEEQRNHKSALNALEIAVTSAILAHQESVSEQIRTLTTMIGTQTSLIDTLRLQVNDVKHELEEQITNVRIEAESRVLDMQAHIHQDIDRLTDRVTVLDLPFKERLRWLFRGRRPLSGWSKGWPPLVRPLPPPPAPPERPDE